jgi:hypothetical protein
MRDVLVVVPGILGSALQREGRTIWGGAALRSALVNPASLRLTGDGFSPDPDVKATGLIGRLAQFPGLSKIDAYDRLLDELRQRFELLDDVNLVVFPYDWRLSATVNAKLLAERIDPVLRARRRAHPEARFIFICHSMGGLVVQHFTDIDGGADDTKEVITLGTPFRGAVKAFGVLSRGWPAWLPVVRSRFRALAQSLPSVYELLPRYQAIVDGADRRRLAAGDLGDGVSVELFERACAFHDALDVGGVRPYGRVVIVGALQPTAQFAVVHDGEVEILKRWRRHGHLDLDQRGDGTVPRQSVTPPEWPDDAHAVPFAHTHVALPTADTVFRVLYHAVTATPRAEQADERAKLAIDVPDIIAAGASLEVVTEVAQGDPEVPLLVHVEPTGAIGLPEVKSPRPHDDQLVASFDGLTPGDYRVTLEPAVAMPDVRGVWDLVTVIDPALETG